MKKKEIKVECECDSCGGTGIYRGFGELDGVGVVCHKCDGTGKMTHIFSYKEFTGRHRRNNVKRVIQTNPGIGTADDPKFGGMTYEEWQAGKKFEPGSEMREYTCPAWWYQCADYKKKPDWKECWTNLGCGRFANCKLFKSKKKCWERWDKEFGGKK